MPEINMKWLFRMQSRGYLFTFAPICAGEQINSFWKLLTPMMDGWMDGWSGQCSIDWFEYWFEYLLFTSVWYGKLFASDIEWYFRMSAVNRANLTGKSKWIKLAQQQQHYRQHHHRIDSIKILSCFEFRKFIVFCGSNYVCNVVRSICTSTWFGSF